MRSGWPRLGAARLKDEILEVNSSTVRWLGHATAQVSLGGDSVLIDPLGRRRCREVDYKAVLITHAHVDHLHKRGRKKITTQVLASKETALIAQARGYEIIEPAQEREGFQLVDTGHILGSRGLLVGDDVYYTGDDVCSATIGPDETRAFAAVSRARSEIR